MNRVPFYIKLSSFLMDYTKSIHIILGTAKRNYKQPFNFVFTKEELSSLKIYINWIKEGINKIEGLL